jgi:hypothetical protein
MNFFLFLWVIFAILDPDTVSGSGSTDLIEFGFNPDTDPKHCFSNLMNLLCLQEDMAINETVFHSLLMGHCLNRDKESVDATLEVT